MEVLNDEENIMNDDICGVVLAGGWGTRLLPLTTSINKHLLPVYDEPMIFKSLSTLQRAGIKDVMVVLGGHSGDSFFKLLGDGHRYGMEIRYSYQEQAGGIAEALRLSRDFVGERSVMVILGDNVFEENMLKYSTEFIKDSMNECYLFLREVENPSEFGIGWIDENNKLIDMIEKPNNSDSNLAITGLYIYTPMVFDLIDKLLLSEGYSSRGELEITAINKMFMKMNKVKGIKFSGHWADCGTIDALIETSILVKEWNKGAWLNSMEE